MVRTSSRIGLVRQTPLAGLVRRASVVRAGSDPPIPPAGLLLGSLGPDPRKSHGPNWGSPSPHLGSRRRRPSPVPGDQGSGTTINVGRQSGVAHPLAHVPIRNALRTVRAEGVPMDGAKLRFPESPMPPCRLPQAADDSSNSSVAGCQKGLPNVSSRGGGDDVAVAKLGMPGVARRARGRCPLMTNVPSTEAARRHEWSAATLRIHTERDGRCSYCSERGSTDPWPCLMARLAMHAKGATTPPPGDAPE